MFSVQLNSFIRKQGNINICFFIVIIQRSDKTTGLRSNFSFALGSQYISGQLFVTLSHKNKVLFQTSVLEQVSIIFSFEMLITIGLKIKKTTHQKPHCTESH